jgi:hypothetical protein
VFPGSIAQRISTVFGPSDTGNYNKWSESSSEYGIILNTTKYHTAECQQMISFYLIPINTYKYFNRSRRFHLFSLTYVLHNAPATGPRSGALICSYVHIAGCLVTIDGFWIADIGFIGLPDTARLHFTVRLHLHLHLHTHTHTHILVSTVTSSLPLLGSGFQRWTFFPFLCVPELFPASATSF